MNDSRWLLFMALCSACAAPLQAQNGSTSTKAISGNVTYAITARSANSRQWGMVISLTNAAGEVTTTTNFAYEELATGICYTNQDGQWLDSSETIDIVPDGAQATHGRHTVHWMSNVNTPGGSVHLVSPGGSVFDSKVYGLCYIDTATGSNILIGALQDSQGQLVGSNQVAYFNAFQNVSADIQYIYQRSGLEQNIILRTQLPSPTNFGFNPASTRLEVLTEFMASPAPQKQSKVRRGIAEDTFLDFGDMAIGMGKAFFSAGQGGAPQGRLGIVSKHWTQLSGRQFLIEELPYEAISNAVQSLPPQAAVPSSSGAAIRHTASLLPLLPRQAAGDLQPEPMQLARSAPGQPGVVVDYTTFTGGESITTNFTFQTGQTYYVSGALEMFAATTFQEGAIIKLPGEGAVIDNEGYSAFEFEGDPDVPIVFTSVNDNSVGQTIVGSTGSPGQGAYTYVNESGPGDYGNDGVTVSGVIFAYAGYAYEDDNDSSHVFTDCQFVQSGGIYVPSDTDIYLGNLLFAGGNALEGADYANLTVDGENITADSCSVLDSDGDAIDGGFTNCIFTACDGSETSCAEDHTTDVGSSTGVYASGGDNHYYLPVGSGNRGAGTYGIAAGTLAELGWTTTYTPQDGSYLNTGVPDLGYHYPISTSYYDGVPDSWEMEYLGTSGYAGGDLDAQGNTLLYDYENSIDPNFITFLINVTNQYVNTTNVNLQLGVTGGAPTCYAVTVNGSVTNWLSFASTNLTANLGSTDGVYTVSVGLNGSTNDPYPAWQTVAIVKDTVPAVLCLTNMSNYTGSRPFIDPAGYANKALRSLTFAVTNSLGAIQQGQGAVVDQQCNPVDMCHTTNWFACLDMALTLGTNYISIQAVDWEGNVTRTNFAYDYDTNLATGAPAIALLWPQNGMQLSGSSYTLRGTLDDDTATVTGQYTDTNGNPHTVCGLVERGGQFWVENLPLYAATNALTVTATNAAGFGATTNLTLYQSGVTLAVNAVDSNQLDQVSVNVTGTISTNSYAVWVNGVLGTNNGDGTWSANNVPVTAGGTGSFDLAAYPPGSAPTNSSWTNFGVQQAAYANVASTNAAQASVSEDKAAVVYIQTKSYIYELYGGDAAAPEGYLMETNVWNWTRGAGGTLTVTTAETNTYYGESSLATSQIVWPPDAGYVPTLGGNESVSEVAPGYSSSTNYVWPYAPVFWIENGGGSETWGLLTWFVQASQMEMLFTGGKALRLIESLFVLNQGLSTQTLYGDLTDGDYLAAVPSPQISLGAYGNEDTNGNVWLAAGGGENLVIRPMAPQPWTGGNLASVGPYTLTHYTRYSASTDTNDARTHLGIAEEVDFDGMPSGTHWTTTGGGLSATIGGGMTFTAPSNAVSDVTVTANAHGQLFPVDFSVLAPSGVDHAQIIGTYHYPPSTLGAGMSNQVWIAPTWVSFYRLSFMEVPGGPTNVTGICTNWGPLNHTTAGFWFGVDAQNYFYDGASSATRSQAPLTIYAGGWDWVIPTKWQVTGSSLTNPFVNWTQSFRVLNANGDFSVSKFGLTVTRTTNDEITTSP